MDVRSARLEIPFSRYQLFTNPKRNGRNSGRCLIEWWSPPYLHMGVGIYLGLVGSGLVTAFVLTKLLKGIKLI